MVRGTVTAACVLLNLIMASNKPRDDGFKKLGTNPNSASAHKDNKKQDQKDLPSFMYEKGVNPRLAGGDGVRTTGTVNFKGCPQS